MKIMGNDIDLKNFLLDYGLNAVVILDIFLISVALIFQLPNDIDLKLEYFDLIVCFILLAEYAYNLYLSPSKKEFILDPMNILALVASIPFDLILATVIPGSELLKYLRLLRLIRVFLLSSRLKFIRDLCEKTGLHKILTLLFITIIVFSLLFNLISPNFDIFKSIYFVIVTLTTVGYGDVTPDTYNEKVLTIVLILIGIFVFSTIIAAMSSYLTDKILEKEDEDIIGEIEEKSEKIMSELKIVQRENKQLKEEICELKELIKEK